MDMMLREKLIATLNEHYAETLTRYREYRTALAAIQEGLSGSGEHTVADSLNDSLTEPLPFPPSKQGPKTGLTNSVAECLPHVTKEQFGIIDVAKILKLRLPANSVIEPAALRSAMRVLMGRGVLALLRPGKGKRAAIYQLLKPPVLFKK